MRQVTLIVYRNTFYHVADVIIKDEGKPVETASVNLFYEVTPEWILIFDAVGGCGTGYQKGNVIRRIFIGNAEFKTETTTHEEARKKMAGNVH